MILQGMMIQQYANYVLQKMIEVVNGLRFNMIVDVVRRNMVTLVKYTTRGTS